MSITFYFDLLATAFLSAFSLNIIFFHFSESFSFHSSCFIIHIVLHLFATFFICTTQGILTSMGVERYAAVLNEGLGGAKEELNYSGKSRKLLLRFGFSELKIVQLHGEIWVLLLWLLKTGTSGARDCLLPIEMVVLLWLCDF